MVKRSFMGVYIATDEGWLYLAAVEDLFHRKIVGWAMDSTMTRQLVLDALRQAVWRYQPSARLIHHSDRGSQYASHEYQQALKDYKMIGSMSRKGNCYDNACMESFFGTLKRELIYGTRFRTRAEARQAILTGQAQSLIIFKTTFFNIDSETMPGFVGNPIKRKAFTTALRFSPCQRIVCKLNPLSSCCLKIVLLHLPMINFHTVL